MRELGIGNTQHFESYLETVFRDWVWGQKEIQGTLDSILPRIKKFLPEESAHIVALGTGAGRLMTELAEALPQTRWLGIDINPFLLQVHHQMTSNREFSYWEVPINPRSLDDVAVRHQLRPVQFSAASGRVCLMASEGVDPPIKAKAVDAVFCSWWVDIIPDDLQNVMARLNRVLVHGGFLFIHGPLGFSAPHESRAYTAQEILDWVSKYGFELVERDEFEEPYLHSPYSRIRRFESVSWFVFKKTSETKQPPAFKAYPEYLLNLDAPIGPIEEFQLRAADSSLRYQVYRLIDGKRSFNELTRLISTALQIDSASTKVMLEQILTPDS